MSDLQAPKGTFDVLPASAIDYSEVEAATARVLGRAGYLRIQTPIFESTELFARGVGESTDIVAKEMYTFDDGGGRSVTLRPEGTASICRSYIENGMHKLPQPIRVWYSGPFFRHEAPQAGRFRQFHQIGAEALGSDRPEIDAEMVLLLAELLEELSVGDLRLRLGSLGSTETRLRYRELLQTHLRANQDKLSAEVKGRIDINPLRAFDSADPSTQEVMATAPVLLDSLDPQDAEHFQVVRDLLDAAGVAYEVDPRLVRGLDYYGRTVFEFTSDRLGAQSGVGGGGRYDGLMELLGGQATPGIGWAAGVERILLAREPQDEAQPRCDLLVVALESDRLTDAFVLAKLARGQGIEARLEVTGRSVKAALKHANKIGALAVALLDSAGDQLKNMDTGEQVVQESATTLLESLRGMMV